MTRALDQSNLDGCLIQIGEHPATVMYCFDMQPRELRDAINDSPYKLCAICAAGEYSERGLSGIRRMEEKIAAQLGGPLAP